VQVGSVSRDPVCLIGGGETTVTLKGQCMLQSRSQF
jgi:glycerate-2-kinase